MGLSKRTTTCHEFVITHGDFNLHRDNQNSHINQFLSVLDSSYFVQLITFPILIVIGILLTMLSINADS
jgi:hypothetical protein